MEAKAESDDRIDPTPSIEQVLQDKKLKGQLVVMEDLYGKSAHAAAKAEKVNSFFTPSQSRSTATCRTLIDSSPSQPAIHRRGPIISGHASSSPVGGTTFGGKCG